MNPNDRIRELEEAIRSHRAQKADDRCIEDDDRLYAVLGDGISCDRRVGSKEEMLANCRRFIERRCEEGGPWLSYAELERRWKDAWGLACAFYAQHAIEKGGECACDLCERAEKL